MENAKNIHVGNDLTDMKAYLANREALKFGAISTVSELKVAFEMIQSYSTTAKTDEVKLARIKVITDQLFDIFEGQVAGSHSLFSRAAMAPVKVTDATQKDIPFKAPEVNPNTPLVPNTKVEVKGFDKNKQNNNKNQQPNQQNKQAVVETPKAITAVAEAAKDTKVIQLVPQGEVHLKGWRRYQVLNAADATVSEAILKLIPEANTIEKMNDLAIIMIAEKHHEQALNLMLDLAAEHKLEMTALEVEKHFEDYVMPLAYGVKTPASDPKTNPHITFNVWMNNLLELKNIKSRRMSAIASVMDDLDKSKEVSIVSQNKIKASDKENSSLPGILEEVATLRKVDVASITFAKAAPILPTKDEITFKDELVKAAIKDIKEVSCITTATQDGLIRLKINSDLYKEFLSEVSKSIGLKEEELVWQAKDKDNIKVYTDAGHKFKILEAEVTDAIILTEEKKEAVTVEGLREAVVAKLLADGNTGAANKFFMEEISKIEVAPKDDAGKLTIWSSIIKQYKDAAEAKAVATPSTETAPIVTKEEIIETCINMYVKQCVDKKFNANNEIDKYLKSSGARKIFAKNENPDKLRKDWKAEGQKRFEASNVTPDTKEVVATTEEPKLLQTFSVETKCPEIWAKALKCTDIGQFVNLVKEVYKTDWEVAANLTDEYLPKIKGFESWTKEKITQWFTSKTSAIKPVVEDKTPAPVEAPKAVVETPTVTEPTKAPEVVAGPAEPVAPVTAPITELPAEESVISKEVYDKYKFITTDEPKRAKLGIEQFLLDATIPGTLAEKKELLKPMLKKNKIWKKDSDSIIGNVITKVIKTSEKIQALLPVEA